MIWSFRKSVKECVALAHLPLDVLEKGLKHIEEKFEFEDEKANAFEGYFLKYIQEYWIDGCYPSRCGIS